MLRDRDETLPLGASWPGKALKKKVPAPEPGESSSGGEGGVSELGP